jgi:hypothetical protein
MLAKGKMRTQISSCARRTQNATSSAPSLNISTNAIVASARNLSDKPSAPQALCTAGVADCEGSGLTAAGSESAMSQSASSS